MEVLRYASAFYLSRSATDNLATLPRFVHISTAALGFVYSTITVSKQKRTMLKFWVLLDVSSRPSQQSEQEPFQLF